MKWQQEGNKLTVDSLEGNFFFLMPDYFKLETVDPDLIRLAELVLFYPWNKSLAKYNFSRKRGEKTALCFSGGIDSMAAYCLLPKDTILFYHKREARGTTMMKLDNPLRVFRENKLNVEMVTSDQEEIQTFHGNPRGFSTDMAHAAAMILLADYWNLGYIATGTMLESTYIYKGYKYRDFSEDTYWNFWFKIFKSAGLELVFPVMPCSEYLNWKIVTCNNKLSISCIRGSGEPCGKCYKCFRKLCIGNIKTGLDFRNKEISSILTTRPLKQAASLIYAMNKYGHEIPEIHEYKKIDLEWLEGYYDVAMEKIPEKYKEYLKNELEKYSTPMDRSKIKLFNLERL